nr:unnamed protein product [Naegleria fowleri]
MNGMEPKRFMWVAMFLVWGACGLFYIVLNRHIAHQGTIAYESMSSTLSSKNRKKPNDEDPSVVPKKTSNDPSDLLLQKKVFPITYLNFDFLNQDSVSNRNIEVACSSFISSYFSRNLDHKIPPVVVGYGDQEYVSDYIHEEDFVFFFDGLDSMFTGDTKDMIHGYMEYLKEENFKELNASLDWPIIFNSERNKWPPEGEFGVFIKNFDRNFLVKYRSGYPVKAYCPRHLGFFYLNSGMYLGRKKDIKKFFQTALSVMPDVIDFKKVDDQAVVQYLYIENKFPIIGDCRSSIFLASYLACDFFHVNASGCFVTNKLNPPQHPQAVHSNGPKCNTYCPCLYENMQRSDMKSYLEKEKMLQNVSSVLHLNNLKNNLKIDLYHAQDNKIVSVLLTKFCSEQSLFYFNKDNCLKK